MRQIHSRRSSYDRLFSIARSLVRSIARSLDRSLTRSLAGSIARSLDRLIASSLARSIFRSLDRSLDHRLTLKDSLVGRLVDNFSTCWSYRSQFQFKVQLFLSLCQQSACLPRSRWMIHTRTAIMVEVKVVLLTQKIMLSQTQAHHKEIWKIF